MKEFLTNKFGLIQFENDGTLSVVETRALIPPKGQTKLNYDAVFTLGIKSSNSKNTRKMFCKVLLLSGEQNICVR